MEVEALAADVGAALADDPRVKAAFEKLAPSCRREYLEWIDEAKRPETRSRRILKTLEMLRK